jgi:hypothetical protein
LTDPSGSLIRTIVPVGGADGFRLPAGDRGGVVVTTSAEKAPVIETVVPGRVGRGWVRGG